MNAAERVLLFVKNSNHAASIIADTTKEAVADCGICDNAVRSMNLWLGLKSAPSIAKTHNKEPIETIKPIGFMPSALRRKP